MNKHTINIAAEYLTNQLNGSEYKYIVEQHWSGRPAWIKLLNHPDPLPRFLSIYVPEKGEVVYKSFGHYYYPIDYTNDEERRFMDGMAEDYDSMVADSFNIPMAKALLERMPLNLMDTNARVLDIGCGTGIMTDLLMQQGFTRITLVDFSPGMLDQARKKFAAVDTIRYENVDVTKQMPDGTFDLVVSVMLFNTFQPKTTDIIFRKLFPHLTENAIVGILEDWEQPAYRKYFNVLFSGMVETGKRTKYVFVGKKK